MPLTRVMLSLTLAFFFAATCVAQETKVEDNPKAKKASARAVASTVKQMMRHFSAAELTDEQKEKAQGVVESHIAKHIEARKASDGLLTDAQKEKRKAAIADAKEAGKKGNKVYAIGIEAMGLSEEEAKAFEDSRKSLNAISNQMKAEITALLTDDQKAKLPKKKKGKKGKKKDSDTATAESKTQTVSLKLPGMT